MHRFAGVEPRSGRPLRSKRVRVVGVAAGDRHPADDWANRGEATLLAQLARAYLPPPGWMERHGGTGVSWRRDRGAGGTQFGRPTVTGAGAGAPRYCGARQRGGHGSAPRRRPGSMTEPHASATRERALRTYVVLHYHGRAPSQILAGAAPPRGDAGRYAEAEPLGTVEAHTPAEARAEAARRWPDVPPRALRTRTARQAGPGPLAVALAKGAERDALARDAARGALAEGALPRDAERDPPGRCQDR